MEARLAKLELSHIAIAQTISHVGADVKKMNEHLRVHVEKEEEYQRKVEEHMKQSNSLARLTPEHVEFLIKTVEGVQGMDMMRKGLLGLSAMMIAVGTLVYGFIHIIKAIR
ncbi:MAG: hypothetical protein IPO40_24435 [Fibrobacteres bacterium]|nr:hypothetical protein [Fibrobacterota bacterium]